MLLLSNKNGNITKHLASKKHKYTHHEIQNELLDLMARQVLHSKVMTIEKNRYFAIMVDECTDKSNKEQLSFCVRTVADSLKPVEEFLGFYELENIKSDTIVRVIKDVMLRLNIQLENCRGQTYNGASNMLGKISAVATQILSEQPKAVVTHCHGHSLSPAVKDLTTNCKVLSDTMSTVAKICVFIKHSPKRENVLARIRENVKGEFTNMDDIKYSTHGKLCVTRWTQ